MCMLTTCSPATKSCNQHLHCSTTHQKEAAAVIQQLIPTPILLQMLLSATHWSAEEANPEHRPFQAPFMEASKGSPVGAHKLRDMAQQERARWLGDVPSSPQPPSNDHNVVPQPWQQQCCSTEHCSADEQAHAHDLGQVMGQVLETSCSTGRAVRHGVRRKRPKTCSQAAPARCFAIVTAHHCCCCCGQLL
jgi:hypothetical protein